MLPLLFIPLTAAVTAVYGSRSVTPQSSAKQESKGWLGLPPLKRNLSLALTLFFSLLAFENSSLSLDSLGRTVLHQDNISTIRLIENNKPLSQRTLHINNKYFKAPTWRSLSRSHSPY
jgi:hypothetical protein